MRLGGPVMKKFDTPDEWVRLVNELKFKAVYFPCDYKADKDLVKAYQKSAYDNDLVIAEIGAWSNPMSKDESQAKEAMEYCKNQLALADETGARCCVNITGSRGDTWDGPAAENYADSTFDMIVEKTREIIDSVKPKNTFYTLELMPWMFPDSADSYLKLIKAVDRRQCAVHLDPVNIICSVHAYYNNGAVIRECFDKLGVYIKSCHAKDILIEKTLTLHLNEKRIGDGELDYKTYLDCLNKLDKDTPIMLEHLASHEDVVYSAENIRTAGKSLNVNI